MGFFDSIVQNDSVGTVKTPVQSGGGFFDNIVSKSSPKSPLGSAPAVQDTFASPTAQSTPQIAKPGTPDVIDYLFNPKAQTKIQPLGFTKEQAPTFTGPRAIFGPTKIITDFFTDVIKGVTQAVSDVGKLVGKKDAPVQRVTVPKQVGEGFLPEGGTDMTGKIQSVAQRTVARQQELDKDTPATPGLNAAQAMFEVGEPASFNLLFAEDIAKNATQSFLKNTGFQSTLGLKYSTLANVPAEDFVKTVSDRTRTVVTSLAEDLKAGKITQKDAEVKMTQIAEEYHNLGDIYRKQDSPRLNKLGQLFENTSIALNEDVGQLGKRDYSPLGGVARPAEATPPGSRTVPGQAPAFGMSTEAVENVGGETPKGGFFDNLVKSDELQVNAEKNGLNKEQIPSESSVVKPNIQVTKSGVSLQSEKDVNKLSENQLSTDSKSIDNSIVNKENIAKTSGNTAKPEFPVNSSEKPNSSSISESPDTSSTLAEEARKYKSAEEFISKGTKSFDNLPEYAKNSLAQEARANNLPEIPYRNSRFVEVDMPIADLKGLSPDTFSDTFTKRSSVTKGPIVVDDVGKIIDGNNRAREAFDRGDNSIKSFVEVPKIDELTDLYNKATSKESSQVEKFSRSFLGKATPTLGRGGRIPHAEIQQYIYKDIPKDQVRLIFRDGLVDGYANGKYTGVRAEMKGILKPMIELSSKGGKSKITTAFHESGHYIFDNFLSTADKRAVLKLAEKEMGPITSASYRLSGYEGKENILEEYVMDKYADYKANEAGYASSPFKSFFRKLDEIIQKIKDIYNKAKGNIDKFFEERGGSQSGRINYMDPLGEGEPKKTPFGKSVGKITVGGKEIDVTKGGTMEIPVSKTSLQAKPENQVLQKGKEVPRPLSSVQLSQNQKSLEKTDSSPQLQPKAEAMSQTGQRPLGSFPQTKVDTIKSSLKDRLQPNEIKVNKTPEVAFEQSKNQVPIGNTKFVIGDYGKNAIERKTELGQNDRLPISDLSASIDHIKSAYVAGDSSFRKGNIVHISEMPNGETRAIITRKNLSGKEEVINFFKVGRPVAPFIENLKSFGIPERNRTSDRLVRTEELYPLSYGDKNIVSKSNPNVKQIDNLIANGKIKVVSLSGKDTYLVKTGDTWKTARDEDSAIVQATPKEKTVIELPPELEQKVKAVEMQKEQLDNSPFKSKSNSIFKDKEGRVRELGDVKNPETIKKMEDRIAESGIQDPTKFAEGMETYFDKKKEVAKMEKEVKAEVADYKKNGSRIKALERIKALRADVKTLESNGLTADKQKAEIKKLAMENKLGLGSSGAPLKTSREGVPIALTERQKNIVENSPFKNGPEIDHPPLEGSYGEVKSVENLAKQAESIMHGNDIPPNVTMRELIEKTVTPVTRKVHTLDTFLTTPDYVMEKIGFGSEAKDLRRAADNYWKELPKNLAKIEDWSKAVPEKSNIRIFKYLDGQAIDLRPDEHLVASEVKKWLREWADRLGLEEDARVSDYITRIFDDGFNPKEFDEDLAKIIVDKVPGSVYNPFTLKRLGAKGYQQDTWKALQAYVKRATRKVYFDPVLEKIQARTGQEVTTTMLETSQFEYIQKYINNINMRPTKVDIGGDNFIKTVFQNPIVAKVYKNAQYATGKASLGHLRLPDIGQRPVTSITRALRRTTSRALLWFNMGSAVRNLSQGANTYAILGEKHTLVGYMSIYKKGATEELEREGVLNASFIQDRVLSITGKLIQKGDSIGYVGYTVGERINRGSAYFGAKSKYYADHTKKLQGIDVMPQDIEEKAIEYAKSVVRKTQFYFDPVDTPVGLGSDTAKTLTHLIGYSIKQIEFLFNLAHEGNFSGLLRYAIAGLAFVYTIGRIIDMKPQDLIPQFTLKLIPPIAVAPIALYDAVTNAPDKYGNTLSLGKKVSNTASAFLKYEVPGGTQINKSYQALKAVQQGGSMDAAGRKQFSVGGSLGKNIQAIAFGKYANSAADDHFNGITEAERTYDNISKSKTAKDDFDKLIKANPALAKEVLAIAKRRQAGITPDDEKIINMGVASGARARYVADKLNNLKTNQEKGALWVEYVKKKIITKDVATQLAKLIKK